MRGMATMDAVAYLKTVREVFEDRMDKYDEFLNIMKDFKAQRADTSGVVSRVKELFQGNRDLILGFNAFLPKECEITLPPEEEPFLKRKPVEFGEAIDFVTKIKTRFQDDDHVYKAFLDILNMYRKDHKSIQEVYQEVSVLFQDHPDILIEFTHFLPDVSGTPGIRSPQPVRHRLLFGDDRDSPVTIAKPTLAEKKPVVSNAVCDRFANQLVLDQRDHVQKEKENKEGRDKNELGNDNGLDHKKKYIHQDDSVTDQFQRGVQDTELSFLDRVSRRIQDPEIRRKISNCIRSFKSKFVTADQFRTLVSSLIGTHPDLIDACEDLITYIENNGSLRSNKQVIRSSKVDGDVDWDTAGRNKNKEDDHGERDRYDRGLGSTTKDVPAQKLSSYASKEYLTKPIHELDLSNCESCTPSYRLLPENYPIPIASRRTKIGDEVLNDRWVSVTSGSEDYSFKHMRKNQYEESLFRCEDDRFELDMLLESATTTVRRIEEFLAGLDPRANKTTNVSFRIEDHLTALDLRCIERLYGDHGVDVMEVLRTNAQDSLPIILTRLKQKQEEWAKCRMDFNKVWAEIYAKNYHKSLDHRSFYFKQQDTKNLSAKALLAEIKEMSERSQNEDETILIAGAAHKKPARPHMEFEYPDTDIQDDLYHLIKYSCGELCTPEQRDKIMKIWTTFLEPVLGVPSRPPSGDGKEDSVNTDNYVAKSGANDSEENRSPAVGATSPCKPSNMSSRVLMAHGNSGVKSDCFPNSDTVSSQSDAHRNSSRLISDKSWANKQAGFEEGSTNSAGGKINEENASARNKGPDFTDANHGIEAMSGKGSEDGVTIKQTTYSIDPMPEDVKHQICHEASEAHPNIEREEGELPPHKDLEEKKILACGNAGPEAEHTVYKVDPSTRRNGGQQIRVKVVGDETDVNPNDEGEESAHGSSESENASENGDVSASQSPNVEECSPEEPDDDGDNDEKAEREVEADDMVDAHDAEGTTPFSDCFLQTVKPLNMKVSMSQHGKERISRIFYGNDSFYLLFRFHQILYSRMQSAKLHASSPENKWRILNNAKPADSYARFKEALQGLLNGSSDNAKFEDECRAIIGAQSYVLFTLDKLIHKLIKQLQTITTDEMDNKLLLLYAYENSRSHGTFHDAIYHQNACFLLPEDNLYRIEYFPCPTRLTIQLMKNEQDRLDPKATSMDPKFEAYLNEILSSVPRIKARARLFLKRNIRKFSSGDEASDFQKAMEGVIVQNGLEMRVNCSTSKVSYVVGTEDFFYRIKKRKIDNIMVRKSLNSLFGGASGYAAIETCN